MDSGYKFEPFTLCDVSFPPYSLGLYLKLVNDFFSSKKQQLNLFELTEVILLDIKNISLTWIVLILKDT